MVYTLSTAFAVYFVVWWIVLFAVLPFGIQSQHEAGESPAGTDPGAPSVPGMAKKLLWTTVISAILFGIAWWAYLAGYLNIERLYLLMGFTR